MGRKRSLVMYYQNLGHGFARNKLTQIEVILQFRKPEILMVAESLIDAQTAKYLTNTHNYHIECTGGRLWAAIKKGCKYTRRKDLEVPGMPLIWLHVGTSFKYFAVGFYREFQRMGVEGSLRLPEQRRRFDQFLDSWGKVLDTGEDCHLLRDMILDLKKWRQNGGEGSQFQPLVDELFNKIMNRNITQTVTKITCHRGIIESILDLHFTNCVNKVASTSVCMDVQSDCAGIMIQRKGCGLTKINVVKRRTMKKINYGILRNLYIMKLGHILRIQDPDEATERLTAAIRVALDSQAKVETVDIKRKYAGWMNDEIKDEIKKKIDCMKKV